MCARQHTFHSKGSLLPTREDIAADSITQLPISVLELTKKEVVFLGGGGVVTGPATV